MGSKTWRNLSLLLLASAALVGCNNTQPRDRTLGAGPKPGDPPTFAGGANPNSPFPKAAGTPGAQPNGNAGSPFAGPGGNVTPGGNFPATPGAGLYPSKDSFTPAGGGALRPETPKDISTPVGAGNLSPLPYPGPTGITPPPRNDVFGGARPDAVNTPNGANPVIPTAPSGFNPR